MKTFIIFLGRMHSGSDEVSSKRVYASLFVLLVIVMVIGSQFCHKPLDYAVFVTILGAVGTLCGMNLTAQMKAMEVKKGVASDMVNVTQDNEAAKDVLQGDKPNG